MGPPGEVTQLLAAWEGGDRGALEKLVPLVYDELHRLAHRHMAKEQPGHTLQTTALIHEAYLRLVDVKRMGFENRAHFFAACAQIMRRILVDLARTRGSLKRGGSIPNLTLDEALAIEEGKGAELAALDEALTPGTVQRDWRLAKVWLLRELDHGVSHGTGAVGAHG